MRVAVFADIHGNPYACKAVLEAIEKDVAANGVFNCVVAAGDHCAAGSDPVRCIQMLQAAGVTCLYGNTEAFTLAPDETPKDQIEKANWRRNQPIFQWLRRKIGSEGLQWMQSLAFGLRVSPTPNPADDLLVVHANPKDVDRRIMPALEVQETILGENLETLRQPDDDPELADMMDGVSAAVIAFGHFHYSSIRHWRDKMLVDVSPCSIAPYDHDLRARYSIFQWADQRWSVARRFVSYDTQNQARALRNSDMPEAEHYAQYYDSTSGSDRTEAHR